MYSFKCDYSEGAHPQILKALEASNFIQTEGYGEDPYCQEARQVIQKVIGRDDIAIHFFVGGTQANTTALSAFLRPHEAIISVDSGHICVHETGAIESTGHKIIPMAGKDGKLRPEDIQTALASHTDEHMVKPKLVYISNSTEVGTLYKKSELEAISTYCRDQGLILYIDGARLGSALMSSENDLTLNDLAQLTDAFYIGGTKNGALFGEALVISQESLNEDFRYHIKQKGGLLAKGRLLGIQYLELFKNNLFFDLAKHANTMSDLLRQGIEKAGYSFLTEAPTNQIFPILPLELVEALEKDFAFYRWCQTEEGVAIRLITSWATKEEEVQRFIQKLNQLSS